MVIHHFFSDVLLSVYEFLEQYMFNYKPYFYETVLPTKPLNFLKSVQFNIGNRNYQIGDYKESGQLELPTGIFTFVSDETAFGKMGNLIGHHRIWDVNEIVCTHNTDTNVDIMLREEQAILYLTVQINCESIHQSNEVIHQVKRFLPPMKYEQLAPFSSFLEIPPYFFSREHNDPEKHNIENLYCQYDGNTGLKKHFFLAHYKPMIRLNSATSDISDNSQRAYTVLLDFNYLIQLPMWMFDTLVEKRIVRINLGLTMSDQLSSVVFDNDFLSENDKPLKINDTYYKSQERYVVDLISPNYHDNKIILPVPREDNIKENDTSLNISNIGSITNVFNKYIIQITKLYQRKSVVVNWVGSYKGINKDTAGMTKEEIKQIINDKNFSYNWGNKEIRSDILDEFNYSVQKNPATNQDEFIFDVSNNEDLRPSLNSPIIISLLKPLKDEDIEHKEKIKSQFNRVYEIRDPFKGGK